MTDLKILTEAREAAGARINAETADVWFAYARILDPYGDGLDVPEHCVGRTWFAADPDERIRVFFDDLPETTRNQLMEKRRRADNEGWREIYKALQAAANPLEQAAPGNIERSLPAPAPPQPAPLVGENG